MAYSRWSTSVWYTFWHVGYGEEETADTAIFTICGVGNFTAKQIRDDISKCICDVQWLTREDRHNQPTKDQLIELEGYMVQFLQSVDRKYS